nr:DMT family transporter [Endozoicomonas sp. G2_1]
MIWSTTPLAIVWSTQSMHPSLAVLLRMLVAVVICLLIIGLSNIRLPWRAQAQRLYCYSSLGVFGGMSFGYFSAQYLDSGFMSLVFGLSPIVSGLFEQKLLKGPAFSASKKFAFALAIAGLAMVCSNNLASGQLAWQGVVLIIAGMLCFSLSGVLVKSVNISIHPVATTTGTLIYSTPLFALVWWLTDGSLPVDTWSTKTVAAVVYLAVFGSLIGFIAYFYILQKLPATTVALVTLLTPVLAISLGAILNGEQVSMIMVIGAIMIIAGLAVYQFADKYWFKLAKHT